MTGSLFEFEEESPRSHDRDLLRERLTLLASRGVYVGGSSWKYEGWLGQIYSRENYRVRGRFSKKLFDETCLREYAGVFPTVCGDFAFYQFPTTAFWEKLFRQTAGSGASGRPFRWGFKVPEQITVPVWPLHARYGAQAGRKNPMFLDADLFTNSFLRPIETWHEQVGVLIFEFGTLRQQAFESVADFVRALDPFLDRLPSGWRYAVEIRNAEFLAPDYFACLAAHGVTHVYNSWTRMPDLAEQIAIPESRTTDLLVARALLKKGRPYEEAVAKFAPYTQVQEVNEPVRKALREIVDIALVDGVPAFVFVNNRLEGNSPGTIITITE